MKHPENITVPPAVEVRYSSNKGVFLQLKTIVEGHDGSES